MMPSSSLELQIERTTLILAPILFAASPFYWQHGEYSTTSATLMVLSLFCWLPAFKALFGLTMRALAVFAI